MTKPEKPKSATDQLKPAPETESTPKDEQRSAEEIRSDIDRTRDDLGDTAAALAGKADVKGQAKSKAEDARQAAREKTEDFAGKARDIASKAQDAAPESVGAGANNAVHVARENPVFLMIAAAFVGGLMLGMIMGRR